MTNWNAKISTVDQFALNEYSISHEISYDDDDETFNYLSIKSHKTG